VLVLYAARLEKMRVKTQLVLKPVQQKTEEVAVVSDDENPDEKSDNKE